MLSTILIIILILLLIGALPTWPYSAGWRNSRTDSDHRPHPGASRPALGGGSGIFQRIFEDLG